MTESATRVRPRRGLKLLLLTITVLVLGAVLYTGFLLSWSYSEGERVGILQKSSRKGWICKTWEGELAQYVVGGVAPLIWEFSVRDAAVAAALEAATGQRVRLHFTEHPGLPSSCFGETSYFVDRVEILPSGVGLTPAIP